MSRVAQKENAISSETGTVCIQLPQVIIEDLKYVARYHKVTLKTEVARAVLKHHARSLGEILACQLEKSQKK